MDTGQSYISLQQELSELPALSSAKDLENVIDMYIGREGSWHMGATPLQTFLSCLYVENLLTHYIGYQMGSFLIGALQDELSKWYSAAKTGKQPSSSHPTNTSNRQADQAQDNDTTEKAAESFSKGPKHNLLSHDLHFDTERKIMIENDIRCFLQSLQFYELLTMIYFVGAIKTIDLCVKHYMFAKSFVFAQEDIGLYMFNFQFLTDVGSSRIRLLLMEVCQLLELEIKQLENKQANQSPDVEKVPDDSKKKSKSKSKSKTKKLKNDNQKLRTRISGLRELKHRFKMRSEIIYFFDQLPHLPTASRCKGLASLIDDILLELPVSILSTKSNSPKTPIDYSIFNPVKTVDPLFSGGIQSRANNNSPQRSLITLSPTDGYVTWKSIVLTITTYRSLISTNKSHNHSPATHISGLSLEPKMPGFLPAFFIAFGSSKPTLPISSGINAGQSTPPLPITRAVLHNMTFNPNARTILGEPVVEWVLRDFRELSGAPYLRVILNNRYSDNSVDGNIAHSLNAVAHLRPDIDYFLGEASTVYAEFLLSFVCNRSRQRQMLAHNIITWDSLEVMAQQLDHAVYEALLKAQQPLNTYSTGQQQLVSKQSNEAEDNPSCTVYDVQIAFPLMWWTSYRRMLIILNVILMGFDLEIYEPWEYAYMYDYAHNVESEIVSLLDIIKRYLGDSMSQRNTRENMKKEAGGFTAVDSSNTIIPSFCDFKQYQIPQESYYLVGDPKTVFIDMNTALLHISGIQNQHLMIKQLCDGQRKLAEAAIMLGYLTRPISATKHTSARLLYQLRMKPFSSIGYPVPPVLNFEDEKQRARQSSSIGSNRNPRRGSFKDMQSDLYQHRPEDESITMPTRVTRRFKSAKTNLQHLHTKLIQKIPHPLSASISQYIGSFGGLSTSSDPTSTLNTSNSNPNNILLSHTDTTLLELFDWLGKTASTLRLVQLKNSTEAIQHSINKLEKHLQVFGGFKNRKEFNVCVNTSGTHPSFPVLEFKQK